jgi:hypothetical protein
MSSRRRRLGGPGAPSGHAARGAGCAVAQVRLRRAVLAGSPTRPGAQRRGLPHRLLPTGPRSFRPAGAALRKQSWSGRPPPPLPAPEQSSVPDGPGESVAGHLFRGPSRCRCRLQFRRVQMTSTGATVSSAASGTSSSWTGTGKPESAADSASPPQLPWCTLLACALLLGVLRGRRSASGPLGKMGRTRLFRCVFLRLR